jgi:hypothetical protein
MEKKTAKLAPLDWINLVLVLPAAISFYGALRNVFREGRFQDFQWSGTSLTFHHIDPYHQALIHDPNHYIILTQVPNYLHELYLLLLPFGAFSFQAARPYWTLMNCLFTAISVLMLRKIHNLDHSRTLLITLLLLISTPFRIALGAGTEALLELFFFCLVFYCVNQFASGIATGLSYVKYSFSPVLFFYFFFTKRHKLLAISLLPPLLGLLLMWLLVHGNLFTLAIEPFLVSRTNVAPGLGDLMTILHFLFDKTLTVSKTGNLAYTLAIAASAGYAFYLSRRRELSPRRAAPAIAVATLMFFTHLTHDYVLLIVPLAACLAGPFSRVKVLVLSAIGIIWYGVKLQPMFGGSHIVLTTTAILVFSLLAGMLMLLSQIDAVVPAREMQLSAETASTHP